MAMFDIIHKKNVIHWMNHVQVGANETGAHQGRADKTAETWRDTG